MSFILLLLGFFIVNMLVSNIVSGLIPNYLLASVVTDLVIALLITFLLAPRDPFTGKRNWERTATYFLYTASFFILIDLITIVLF